MYRTLVFCVDDSVPSSMPLATSGKLKHVVSLRPSAHGP